MAAMTDDFYKEHGDAIRKILGGMNVAGIDPPPPSELVVVGDSVHDADSVYPRLIVHADSSMPEDTIIMEPSAPEFVFRRDPAIPKAFGILDGFSISIDDNSENGQDEIEQAVGAVIEEDKRRRRRFGERAFRRLRKKKEME